MKFQFRTESTILLTHFYIVSTLFVNRLPFSQSRVFSTIFNSSFSFSQLENLIGSIHANAPVDTKLCIYYSNLTTFQISRLSLYENVEIVPLRQLSKITDFVPVTDELIDFERQIFYSRTQPQSKHVPELWPYIDSIRERVEFAVVIPFISKQIESVRDQLNRNIVYSPCQSNSQTDLIFYHNESPGSSLNQHIERLIELFREPIQRYYRKVRIFAADLIGTNDSYLLGSGLMWKKLIDTDEPFSLATYGYTHFLIMEADVWPIRSFWLDQIQRLVHQQKEYVRTPWWIMGSAYRGSQNIGPGFAHINGNALYHLSSNMIAFVRFFWPLYLKNQQMGYDYAITYFFFTQELDGITWRSISHKFHYSDFIQNCWQTGCAKNIQQFLFDNPNTYLIHGGPRWPQKSNLKRQIL